MSPASDSENNARKRVCKACDRCRLKKSKVGHGPRLNYSSTAYILPPSVTAQVRAVVVDRTMQYVSSESVRSRMTRSIQKGRFSRVSRQALAAHLFYTAMSRCWSNNSFNWSMAYKNYTNAWLTIRAGRGLHWRIPIMAIHSRTTSSTDLVHSSWIVKSVMKFSRTMWTLCENASSQMELFQCSDQVPRIRNITKVRPHSPNHPLPSSSSTNLYRPSISSRLRLLVKVLRFSHH